MSEFQKRAAALAAATVLLLSLAACEKKQEDKLQAETPDLAQSGLYHPEPSETEEPGEENLPDTITISMVGDCTLASSQYNNDFERVVGTDYSWPFAGVKDILDEDDFTIANLEGSFSDEKLTASTTFYFCAPADYAKILAEGSVECATMGNNHTKEFGSKGVENTQAALDAVGVPYILGGYGDIYDVQGMKLGVFVSNFGPTTGEVTSGVKKLKSDGADFIIVCTHWGIEGSYHPNSNQVSVAHAAIDAGANVVCGTHPHVLQKTETYGNGYIFYSLGNFSFGGNTNPRDKDSVIAQLKISRNEDGTFSLAETELIPCCLSSKSGGNNYQPIPYEKDTEAYKRTMSKLDGTFTGPDLVVDYSSLHGGTTTPAPETAPEGGESSGGQTGGETSGETGAPAGEQVPAPAPAPDAAPAPAPESVPDPAPESAPAE